MRLSTTTCQTLCVALALSGLSAWSGGAVATDLSEIEQRRLFDPTEAELATEAEGRIYICGGLTDRDVQWAVNEEFERVENMMFVRTRKTDEAGEVKRDADTAEWTKRTTAVDRVVVYEFYLALAPQ